MPEFPFSRRQALLAALAALLALTLAGRTLLRGDDDAARAEPLELVAAPAAATKPAVVVHVVGAVRRPGLYRLRDGSRVADAVERAGGATRRADLSLVNLAAPLADGVQIVVPRRAPPGAAPAASSGGAARDGPVHLNSATVEELDALPGIGPATAQKIVDYREQNGGFAAVDDLDAVPGIGPARLEQLRDLVVP